MGYKDFQNFEGATGEHQNQTITLDGGAERIDLPDAAYVKDAELSRDGMDLVLEGPQGPVVIDSYFAQAELPTLHAPDGSYLNADLVNSFVKSSPLYANAGSMTDESPVGAVHEVTGSATVTHPDGTSEPIQLGTPIYQGDIIETAGDGAVNIMFIDETSFAVSEDARLAIDEYVYDADTSEGVTNFSVLKGVFVFTSGFIGREDPDDVHIQTPVGSIGIRGTIIAGDVNNGEITVVEGAIVLRDGLGNEMTLANQFETAQFDTANGTINNMGQMAANDVAGKFSSVSGVAAQLFSSINDVAQEQAKAAQGNEQGTEQGNDAEAGQGQEQNLDANDDGTVDGTVDSDGDGAADGTVEGAAPEDGEAAQQGDEAAASDDASNTEGNTEGGADEAAGAQDTATDQTQGTDTAQMGASEPAPAPMQPAMGSNGGLQSAGTTTTSTGTTTTTSAGTTTTTSPTGSGGTTSQPPPPQTANGETTATQPPPIVTQPPPPPPQTFSVSTQNFSVTENVLGAQVATLYDPNLDVASIALTGPYSDFFQVTSGASAGEAYVMLKSGFDLDYEALNNFNVGFNASDASGTNSFTGAINVNVIDADDPAFYYAQANAGQIGQGQSWSYNFAKDAFDEDFGQDPTVTVKIFDAGNEIYDSGITPYLNNANADLLAADIESANMAGDGLFTLTVPTSMISSSRLIDLKIYVDGVEEDVISMNLYQSTGTLTNGSGNNISGVFYAEDTAHIGTDLNGSGGTVTFWSSDDIIEINSFNSFIDTAAGNDVVTLTSGQYNDISLGDGEDYIISKDGADHYIYGNSGNDIIEFSFETNDVLAQLQATTSTNTVIDGGQDSLTNPFFINFQNTVQNGQAARSFNGNGDTLKFGDHVAYGNGSGMIDFTAIDNDIIQNIEILDTNNGVANTITLTGTDVFDMTDHKNTLVLRGDASDTLDFDTEGSGFTSGGTVTDTTSGDVYDIFFSDGADVTLLVDTDIATTIDGVAV
ncbi:MAG: hypothetical protein CMH27_05375 [Micavibrio sp.]|nr:hypothetical protein [Micavibrio sp.]